MPDGNEEDYLDNLLKSISDDQESEKVTESSEEIEERKIKEQVQEALSKANDFEENVNAFDEDMEETISITPEEIAQLAKANADQKDVSDSDQSEIQDTDPNLNDEELDNHINQMLEDVDLSDIDEIDDKSGGMLADINVGDLSQEELDRLSNMNLDDIIEDATSKEVSVNDLFDAEHTDEGQELDGTSDSSLDVKTDEPSELSAAEVLGLQSEQPSEKISEQ